MTMSGEIVKDRAEIFPTEVRKAVAAFSKKNSQAIIATLLEEGPQSFSQLKEDLGIHQQSLTNSLDMLRDSGLVRKRLTDSEDADYEVYYEVSEFGSRFVSRLLDSLGSVDSFEPDRAFERVENYQDRDTGAEPIVEKYHQKRSDSAKTIPGQ